VTSVEITRGRAPRQACIDAIVAAADANRLHRRDMDDPVAWAELHAFDGPARTLRYRKVF
jgi:hypothetical protein